MSFLKKKKAPKKEKVLIKPEGQLAIDVFHTSTEFCIRAPIAGVVLGDIKVDVDNGMLIIKGDRKEPDTEKDKNYFYQECHWGPFSRQVILPEDASASKIKASLQKGILLIRVPIKKKKKKRKVNISSK